MATIRKISAQPEVADLGLYIGSTAATNHTANYPASVKTGQALLYLVGCDGSGDTPSIDDVPDIIELYSDTETSHGSCIYYKKATGNEGGGNFNVAVTSTEEIVAVCLAINDWDGVTPPALSEVATGSDDSPLPNGLHVPWGGKTLFIAFNTQNNDNTTGYPTGYNDNQNNPESLNNAIGFATRSDLITSYEKPDSFTLNGADAWSAWTIAIKGRLLTQIIPTEVAAATVAGSIVRKIPWTRYPQNPTVNKTHWQGQNLLAFWPLAGGNVAGKKDLAGQQDLSFDSAASTQPVIESNPSADALGWHWPSDGKYLRITDNDEGFDDLYCNEGYGAASNVSFAVKARGDFTAERNYIFGDFSSGSGDHFFYLRTETNNTWSVACVLATASALIWQSGTYAADTDYSLVVTIDFAAEEMKLYIDGALILTDDFSGATGFDASKGFQSNIGNFKGSSTTSTVSWLGNIWDARIYRGVLSQAQALEIHQHPHRIFAPQTQIIPVEAAPAANVFGVFPRRIPRIAMPPSYIGFDKGNFFGSHCIWALIPGWDDVSGTDTLASGQAISVGQRMEFQADLVGSLNGQTLDIETRNHGWGVGSVRSAIFRVGDAVNNLRLLRTDNDIGIKFPNLDNLALITIAKPIGDGRGGDSQDPRIFSCDAGSAANDHDLMVGISDIGTEVRTRIRIGSSTQTVASTGDQLDDDTLAIWAGIVKPASATQVEVIIRYLSVAGTDSRTSSGSVTGSYNPRTTTDIALGGNAGVNDNAYHGEILGCFAFDTGAVFDNREILKAFLDNPWQVFQPITQIIPVAGIVVVGDGPIITSVDGDEIWDDADTGLIITGTGFV